MKKGLIYTGIIICVLLIDLSSKYFVDHTMNENQSISVLGNFVRFTLVHNEGTTFGLLKEYAPYKTILIVKSLTIIVLLVLFRCIPTFIKQSGHQLISRLCLLLLIGGSLGNIIDRLLDKRVTDFIDIGMNGHRWHIFNAADVFQCVGGLAILFFVIWEYREKHRSVSVKEYVKE